MKKSTKERWNLICYVKTVHSYDKPLSPPAEQVARILPLPSTLLPSHLHWNWEGRQRKGTISNASPIMWYNPVLLYSESFAPETSIRSPLVGVPRWRSHYTTMVCTKVSISKSKIAWNISNIFDVQRSLSPVVAVVSLRSSWRRPLRLLAAKESR